MGQAFRLSALFAWALAVAQPAQAQPQFDQASGYNWLATAPLGTERVPLIMPDGTGRTATLNWLTGTGLTAATAPTGSETFPCVQGGATKGCAIGQLRQRAVPISRQRLLGTSTATTSAYTFTETTRAPAEYDAIQLVLISPVVDGTNALKFTVAASDSYGDGINPTVAGAAVTPTAVTWGTTSPRNPRNPGGGAATVFQSGYSGTTPNPIEGYTTSDIIPLPSLTRTDTIGAPPLLHIRQYGAASPYIVNVSLASNAANPANSAGGAVPETFCATYAGADNTAAAGLAVPSASSQGYCPSVEIIYYLRGKVIPTEASVGDSLDQGYCGATAVNCSSGFMNGWLRQLTALQIAAGNPAGYTAWSYQGQYSANFNNRALNAMMLGDCAAGVTHVFFKPYSVNEATTNPPIAADLKLADHVLDWAYKCNITPVLVYLWAGEGIGSAQVTAANAYIDAAKARGVATFDARALVSADGTLTSNVIKPAYVTLNSSGVAVDAIHLNAAGQAAVAALAYSQRVTFNLP